MLTKDDLQAISDLMKSELEPINQRLDNIDNKIDNIENRLDNIEEKIDIMHGVNEEVVKWLEKWYGHDFDRPFPVEFEPEPDEDEETDENAS